MDFAREACPGGARPTQIEVDDETIYDLMREQLRELNIHVMLVPSLKIVEVVTEGIQRMLESQVAKMNRLENVPGMTESHLRGFAEAAKVFFEAAPWTQFDNMTLLHIVSPTVEKDFRHANIMGAAGEQFGIAFFPTYQRFKSMIQAKDPMKFMAKNPAWSVTFDPAEIFVPADLETWQRLNLPVCREQMYPVPLRYDGAESFDYPNPDQLREMELILRTIAMLKPADFEPRSRKHLFIGTANGPQKVVVEALRYFDLQENRRRFRELFQMLGHIVEAESSESSRPAAQTTRKRKRGK